MSDETKKPYTNERMESQPTYLTHIRSRLGCNIGILNVSRLSYFSYVPRVGDHIKLFDQFHEDEEPGQVTRVEYGEWKLNEEEYGESSFKVDLDIPYLRKYEGELDIERLKPWDFFNGLEMLITPDYNNHLMLIECLQRFSGPGDKFSTSINSGFLTRVQAAMCGDEGRKADNERKCQEAIEREHQEG